MYSTCLFCRASLGRNEMIEHFPVGRRLAYDAARGRLWVVCRECRQWNLTPLDERWEAIEEAERLYRDTKLRVATGEVGLARLRDGSELVRIGAPLRPEFAAWRYGPRFEARWRRHIAWGGAGIVATAGLVIAGPVLGLVAGGVATIPISLTSLANGFVRRRRVVARFDDTDGPATATVLHLATARIEQRPDDPAGWALTVPILRRDVRVGRLGTKHDESDPRIEFTGERALQALRVMLPRVNESGGRRKSVAGAVAILERDGGPDESFRRASEAIGRDESG